MSVRYTSYSKAWADQVETELKAQGAHTSRETEDTYRIEDMDGKLLSTARVAMPEYELGKVRRTIALYIVNSDKELKP